MKLDLFLGAFPVADVARDDQSLVRLAMLVENAADDGLKRKPFAIFMTQPRLIPHAVPGTERGGEALLSQLFFADGAMFLLRTPLNAMLHGSESDNLLSSAWLSVLSLEAFLMTIATAFILLAMSKERTELRHKTAAMTDPLTGLLNRRAFLQDAEVLLQQQIARDRPIAVLLIDLDHFKSINDRFGHAVGDKVLQIFARTTRAGLRQTDLLGRLGGEEFTVVLADASIDNAYLVADRLRNAFAAAAAVVDDQVLHATASIGVSVIVDPAQDLARLITLADQALYLAKARGRNRVEVAPFGVELDEPTPPRPLIQPLPEQNAA